MLRVGLTGGVGSGKSTAGRLLASWGAHVIDADVVGREMMQPGQRVYSEIVAKFGARVVGADGQLDRRVLAEIGFGEGRIEELNTIVHPAVIARQAEWMREIGERETGAVCVVESALIFETLHGGGGGGGWAERFDRLVLVTAPTDIKVRRFAARAAAGRELSANERELLEAEARRRMARQIEDSAKAGECDFVIANDGSLEELEAGLRVVWEQLLAEARSR